MLCLDAVGNRQIDHLKAFVEEAATELLNETDE